MRQHYFAYLISVKKLLPLVLISAARMVFSLLTGRSASVVITTDAAVVALLILIKALRVWSVRLTVTKACIYIEKGVLIKSKAILNTDNITCYYVNQTPLLRLLGALKLQIFTQSGRAARLYLPSSKTDKLIVFFKLLT